MRLPYFDYAQYGGYFVTLCTKNRKSLFGQIIDGEMQLNYLGKIIENELKNLLNEYRHSEFSHYVIMPNHLHFIWFNRDDVNLSELVRKLKGRTAKRYREYRHHTDGFPLWQRSFCEHIIRNEADFRRIWTYIENNPIQWHLDRFYAND